jgi:hypothetical protein
MWEWQREQRVSIRGIARSQAERNLGPVNRTAIAGYGIIKELRLPSPNYHFASADMDGNVTKASAQTSRTTAIEVQEEDDGNRQVAELNYVPNTRLGRDVLAAGGCLLDQDDLRQEVADRRGEYASIDAR